MQSLMVNSARDTAVAFAPVQHIGLPCSACCSHFSHPRQRLSSVLPSLRFHLFLSIPILPLCQAKFRMCQHRGSSELVVSFRLPKKHNLNRALSRHQAQRHGHTPTSGFCPRFLLRQRPLFDKPGDLHSQGDGPTLVPPQSQ